VETKEIIKLVVEGGLGAAMFVVWLRTFTEMIKMTKEAFDKHRVLSETVIQLLKDEQEYKITLTGVMDRISVRLDTPAQCPILIPGRKIRVEVAE
jgi:hypothetical protein